MKAEWVAPNRTALVLIDCQVDFGAPEGEMAKRGADIGPAQAALAKVQQLVDAARGTGVPVIFVRYVPAEDSAVKREAKARHGDDEPELCVPGTHGAEFVGPQPLAGEQIVSKPLFSAFAGTGLGEQLHVRGIDTVVLAGLTTECCVASSAWDALERDFHIFVARDACAAYEPDLHSGALKALNLSGAILGNAREFSQVWK
ncbi:MAG TPA: cysteine hydrolase [Rhizomicrobium sp.]|jgi:ureidoacrylate peracid hydrolase